jgi:hypothetical protein
MIRWFESVPRPGELVLSRDNGDGHPFTGWRHFLDGRPVECGATLEAVSVREKGDKGRCQKWVRVRYESALDGKDCLVILHHEDGSETQAHDWHHFRWPKDKKGR